MCPGKIRVLQFISHLFFWSSTTLRYTLVGMLARYGQIATPSGRSWSPKKALLWLSSCYYLKCYCEKYVYIDPGPAGTPFGTRTLLLKMLL